jgi:beta-mannanase
MEQQTIDNINEILDRMEARMDEMNKMLSKIVDEIDKHKNGPSKTITMEYDGEIMFRNKRWEHSINKKPSNNEKQ